MAKQNTILMGYSDVVMYEYETDVLQIFERCEGGVPNFVIHLFHIHTSQHHCNP